jgi:hypothetical protein
LASLINREDAAALYLGLLVAAVLCPLGFILRFLDSTLFIGANYNIGKLRLESALNARLDDPFC